MLFQPEILHSVQRKKIVIPMLRHTNNDTINNVSVDEVRNIMNQLKAVGVSIP